MSLFDNREMAIAIWAMLLLAWASFAMRRSSGLGGLLKAFAQKRILTALTLMMVYVVLMVIGQVPPDAAGARRQGSRLHC